MLFDAGRMLLIRDDGGRKANLWWIFHLRKKLLVAEEMHLILVNFFERILSLYIG